MPPLLLSNVHRLFTALWLLASLTWLGGCATPPASFDDSHTVARQRIVGMAERLVGTPYVRGGESPDGVDCSGLVQYAYRQAGIRVPRTTIEQFQAGHSQRHVLPGDLLFFRTDASSAISHVGIYTGQGQMIHASSGSGQVRKVSLSQRYWRQRIVGGATYLGMGNRPITRRGPVTDNPNG